MAFSLVLVTIACSSVINAYPSGAPSEACSNLRPQHGGSAQISASPFELDVTTFTSLRVPDVSSPVVYSYKPNSSYDRKLLFISKAVSNARYQKVNALQF